MATIGRGAAVVELPGGHHLTGRAAWLTWGAVRLALLTGGDSRTAALVNWAWTFFTHDRPSRIILLGPDSEEPADGQSGPSGPSGQSGQSGHAR